MVYYIVASLVILLSIMVLAVLKFSRLAGEKGYLARKAGHYVLFVGLCSLCAMLAGQTALFYLVTLGKQSGILVHVLFIAWNLFVIAVMSTILHKAYKNMQAAPDAPDKIV